MGGLLQDLTRQTTDIDTTSKKIKKRGFTFRLPITIPFDIEFSAYLLYNKFYEKIEFPSIA